MTSTTKPLTTKQILEISAKLKMLYKYDLRYKTDSFKQELNNLVEQWYCTK